MSRELKEICAAAADLGVNFPQPDPKDAKDPAEWATMHWNASFARAAGLLARTVLRMCELRMLEVRLVERPMMELCANQAVINSDPKFAEMFSLQEQSSNEGLVEMLEKYGTGSSDEGAEKAAQVAEIAQELQEMGYEELPGSFPPLVMSAKKRFEIADMAKYYDTSYSLASDFTHMNARAVHRYLDGDFDDGVVDGHLALATDMTLRSVIMANDRLGAGLDEQIDALVSEYKATASGTPSS